MDGSILVKAESRSKIAAQAKLALLMMAEMIQLVFSAPRLKNKVLEIIADIHNIPDDSKSLANSSKRI